MAEIPLIGVASIQVGNHLMPVWEDYYKMRCLTNKMLVISIFAGLFFIGTNVSFLNAGEEGSHPEYQRASDPLNATYMIEGRRITLFDGHNELAAAPSSATKIRTSIYGKPVYGNIDGNGAADAAVMLTHDTGGSGTFFYVAAAIDTNDGFQGTNAVLLGDRIAPKDNKIRNGVVVAEYADRRFREPMTVPPSVGRSKYLILERNELKEIAPLGDEEQILEGWVTVGHEVRSFMPCVDKETLWLAGNSPALNDIVAAYQNTVPDALPYTPLFMTLAGSIVKSPVEGLVRITKQPFQFPGSFMCLHREIAKAI